MKKIQLTKGKFAIVDDEDYDFLNRLNWSYEPIGQRGMTEVAQRVFGRHTIPMHFLLVAQKKEATIRHINGNGLDNRKENLEQISSSIFQQSESKAPNKSSVYKGVSMSITRNGKVVWKAQVNKDGKRYFLGKFGTERKAAVAYNEKAKELYGDLAYQNDVSWVMSPKK